MLLFLPFVWAASAARDPRPLPADRLAVGVLRHIDGCSRRIERTLEQLDRMTVERHDEAVRSAGHVSSELRRLRVSLALVETYLLDRRAELRRSGLL